MKRYRLLITVCCCVTLLTVIVLLSVIIGYRWLVQSERVRNFNEKFIYRTEVSERTTAGRITARQIADRLNQPWGMAVMPDQRTVLITEKVTAIIKEIDVTTGEQLATARIGEVSPVYTTSHCGLLDITLHPQFAENHYVYLGYNIGNQDSGNIRPRISRAVYENHTLRDLTPLVTVDEDEGSDNIGTCGIRFAWRPDGTLLASIGHDNYESSQELDSLRGKIIRINDDGSIPSDNPFANQPAPTRGEVFSLGHRDPQGLAVSPTPPYTIWSSEHGPYGGDELNIITSGGNYGWPLVSYGVQYGGQQSRIRVGLEYIGLVQGIPRKDRKYIGGEGSHAEQGFIDPIVNWGEGGETRSIAPSGTILYNGDMFPEWRGDILIATLNSRQIRRVDIEQDTAVGEEIILKNKLGRIRQLAELADGSILAITDSTNGRLFHITK